MTTVISLNDASLDVAQVPIYDRPISISPPTILLPIDQVPVDGALVLTLPPILMNGTAQDGQTLTAVVQPDEIIVSYQWQVLVGGGWSNVNGATGAAYVVQPWEDGWQIRVQAVDDNNVTLTSPPTNAVLDAAGNQYVYESTGFATIGNGLFQYVYGTSYNLTVNSGGEQNIYADGTATFAVLNTGSVQVDWGSADVTDVAGGNQYVWGTANDTTVDSGTQYVGGTASLTTVLSGGEQIIYGGGTANSTMVSGGNQSVFGSADGTTIDTGGLQYVHATAINTTVNNGGEQNVYTDGQASGTTLNAGSVQVDWGSANDTLIAGGNQYVWGTASSTTIESGTQYVEAGGTANGTTIVGGAERVFSGGSANGVTFGGSSGAIVIDQASGFTGQIAGFGSADAIDLSFVRFSSTGTTLGYQANADNTAGTLTLSDGTNIATLALLGQYSASSFALSSDGNGGTSITDPAIMSQAQIAVASSLHI